MTLDQLRYFCAVCQYNGVTSAATALNISQPSVSSAIKSLEAEFNTLLFHRQQKRLVLTPAGQHLLAMSTPLLREANALTAAMHSYNKGNSLLRLGVPPMIGSLFLPQLYKTLSGSPANFRLQVVENDGNGLRHLLSERQIDMALLPHTQPFDRSLCSLKVAELENVCCVPNGHPLASHAKVSLSELCDEPLVLFKNSFFQTERILTAFRALDRNPNVMLYTAQLSTLQKMIAGGSAVGFLFSFLAEQEPNIVGIPLDPPMTTQVSLVWHQSRPLTDGMQVLIDYFNVRSK